MPSSCTQDPAPASRVAAELAELQALVKDLEPSVQGQVQEIMSGLADVSQQIDQAQAAGSHTYQQPAVPEEVAIADSTDALPAVAAEEVSSALEGGADSSVVAQEQLAIMTQMEQGAFRKLAPPRVALYNKMAILYMLVKENQQAAGR